VIRATARYLDRRPVVAMVLGALAAFLIMYFAAPQLTARVDASQPTHSRGQV